MKQLGIESIACMKAEEILGYLEHEHFDALFTDMQMPGNGRSEFFEIFEGVSYRSGEKASGCNGYGEERCRPIPFGRFFGNFTQAFFVGAIIFLFTGIWKKRQLPVR